MYFSIFENYRWFDGSLGGLTINGPTNPADQNRHSIGLAVSANDGRTWAFVDKIIPESINDSDGNPVLGAWSPSAVVVNSNQVDVYFHDALGTKQYVAQLLGGVGLISLERLNKSDTTYRANLDVISHGDLYELTYNDQPFNIVRTFLSTPSNFGTLCSENIIVPANPSQRWPTPHQIIDGNKVHLYFWQFESGADIHHWVRNI